MSTRTQEEPGVGTAPRRPGLDELQRRVVEIAAKLDALCGAVASILQELALPPVEQSVDDLGPLTPGDDLGGLLEDLLPDLTEAVERLREAGERTAADLEADRRKAAADLAAADVWGKYRHVAQQCRTLAATADAICAGLVRQEPPSEEALAAVERGVQGLAALAASAGGTAP